MDIKKILIANRGEIALRAIKTAKKMGISSVAVYALDDRELAYCQEATQSVYLGHGPLKETYLNQEKLIKIAKEYDCDAIYPGYGFLSENANFARLVEESSLVFIGPSAEVITLMGDKKDSKQKMQEIGVPLIPGYHGDEQDENMLLEKAKKIGFPVLIKASAGGGGKGMRIVHSKDEFLEALKSAKREALNAFSDDKVLIEKYILSPRHIEVQVVSDGQGSHYHFYETNPALTFDREKAKGFRLNIPAGTAVRFEPGQERTVELVALSGRRKVYGFRGDIMGDLP